jgi:hypothetical protein
MLDVQQAVTKASEYLRTIYQSEGVTELRLEEVEFHENPPGPRWLITLSFNSTARFPSREFKQFTVDGNDGKVTAMRMVKV